MIEFISEIIKNKRNSNEIEFKNDREEIRSACERLVDHMKDNIVSFDVVDISGTIILDISLDDINRILDSNIDEKIKRGIRKIISVTEKNYAELSKIYLSRYLKTNIINLGRMNQLQSNGERKITYRLFCCDDTKRTPLKYL